jgi:hypothetical protein
LFRDSAIKENPWEIAASGTLTFIPDRPINVYLFKKLGETELKDKTDITKDRYQAVVVARLLLSVFFDDDANWTDARRKAWIEKLYDKFNSPALLRNKFKIAGGAGSLDPAVLHFVPGFEVCAGSSPPAHGVYTYFIIVKPNSGDAISQSGQQITVGESVTPQTLLNHFFNKPSAAIAYAPNDFSCIANWYSLPSIANGTFTVQNI